MSGSPQVKNYIAGLASSHPNEEVRGIYAQLRDLYDKKLWHQLTSRLEALVELPYFEKGDELIQFYSNFIKDFEKKINQLTLAKLVIRIARQIPDGSQSAAFLQSALEKIPAQTEKQAHALILTQIAFLKLHTNITEAKSDLDKVGAILDQITGADQVVYSNYYRVLALYYKIKVVPTDFYRNSLMFLLYTPIEQIPVGEQQALAFDMGIAALVASDIHNFGELLAQPVLNALNGTPNEWLRHFLIAFNAGNIAKFEEFLTKNKAEYEAQPALKSNYVLLREKISILALMELVFTRPAEGKTLTFKEISAATKIPADEVELLVMKAFSVKLVKGVIDEVNSTVTIYWVQPRVLDIPQVKKMDERLVQWIDSVSQLATYMQNETAPELLT
eukprot:TRINITY_DN1043_c0_g2_i1.p1 TRINITY_DN1043_c0_g2~~TRINITY_DN1043_c0_g2_i1.p1  ORF type:complete len:389 (-),score=92.79 TRINITY_DN1043_c0_g2_i1:55-1221(-)